jgi:hypothetical protein
MAQNIIDLLGKDAESLLKNKSNTLKRTTPLPMLEKLYRHIFLL